MGTAALGPSGSLNSWAPPLPSSLGFSSTGCWLMWTGCGPATATPRGALLSAATQDSRTSTRTVPTAMTRRPMRPLLDEVVMVVDIWWEMARAAGGGAAARGEG